MNIYLRAVISTLKDLVIVLSTIIGLGAIFALNFFIISRYILEIDKAFPELSIFLIGLLSIMTAGLEIGLVATYFDKVKKAKNLEKTKKNADFLSRYSRVT